MADKSVVIVGGGLAGLSAAVGAVEAGASMVTLVEKRPKLGGNSAKASFGINAVGEGDSVQAFVEDVLSAAGPSADPILVKVLVERSMDALAWLQSLGLCFDEIACGAGSSVPRIRRIMGFQLVTAVSKTLQEHAKHGKASVLLGAKLVELKFDETGVQGIKYEQDGQIADALGAVVLCSGGFGAHVSMISEHEAAMPTSQGAWTSEEAIDLVTAAGASMVDIDKVLVHPTGFVDPKDPAAMNKVLASESLRQAGGILINGDGRRFCDEKQDVSSTILMKLGQYANREFKFEQPLPIRIILPPRAVESNAKQLGFYTSKGLMVKYENFMDMASELGLDKTAVIDSLGPDAVDGVVFCGEVVPVVHYSLGGVKVDSNASVVGVGGPIPGLFAAGEVVGGIHGLNRIAGNGLLESIVFGRIAGQSAVQLGTAAGSG
eukprot:TRINITY_DN27870_c0_g4_i1.p1 TRINITY_DN27870_c0_g4~~TRINITY_DN27870_c0_g4_i1.p1  ORF type:complete len:455 (-),score=100.03 TRINITY_DN27870_c0_g4_i1:89-1390(-)